MKEEYKRILRREFLSRSGWGLTGVVLGSGLSAVFSSSCAPDVEMPSVPIDDPAPPRFGPFRVGFQSYSLRHFKERAAFLRETRRLGLEYVELYRGHLLPEASPEELTELRGELAEIGVRVDAFGVERFTADHEKNRRLFEFGRALGVRNLSANPDKDAFDSLEKLVQEYDIRIAIHNHGPEDERWRLPEWILEAVRNLDPRIGACVDTGHYLRVDVDPVAAIETLGDRVLGVHFKDFDADMNEVVPGDGRMDVGKTLEALRNVEFEGVFSLEYEAHPEDPVPHMLRAVSRIEDAVAAMMV